MRVCARAFPPTRLLYGGDWPVCTLTASLTDCQTCVMRLLEEEHLDAAQVLCGTAEEVYRLERASSVIGGVAADSGGASSTSRASAPCLNGGICTSGIDAYSCTCVDQYTGTTCEAAPLPCCSDCNCAYSPCDAGTDSAMRWGDLRRRVDVRERAEQIHVHLRRWLGRWWRQHGVH